MTEANYHGISSNAYWGLDTDGTTAAVSALTDVISWTSDLSCKTAESTAVHASTHGKTRVPGFKTSTASVTCLLVGDMEIDEGAEGALELLRTATYGDGGIAFGTAGSGTKGAICTGVEIGTDKDNLATVTYNFQAIGAVTNTITNKA